MNNNWLLVWMLVTALTLGSAGLALAQGKAQTICPVMGAAVNKDIYTDYQGNRVYFCCTACIPEFKKDPGKYLKKLEAEGVQLPSATGK